ARRPVSTSSNSAARQACSLPTDGRAVFARHLNTSADLLIGRSLDDLIAERDRDRLRRQLAVEQSFTDGNSRMLNPRQRFRYWPTDGAAGFHHSSSLST